MTRLMFAVTAGMILATAALTGAAGAADAILLEFSSPHCVPCQAMKPTLEQLKQAGVPVRHIDVSSERELAARYGIRKTPTFIVLSGGRELTRLVGAQSLADLRAALAIDPSGPLIPTGAKTTSPSAIPAPQTRLAPITQMAPAPPSLTSSQPRQVQTSAPNVEPMPSVTRADAVERARAATVRLRVHDGHGYGAGTGTIIDTHGEEALVLTCGHLFRETKGEGKVEIDLFVGGQTQTVEGQVVDYDADNRDIALVVIRPGIQVQPVEVVSTSTRVQNGQTAFSFGCDRGDDPSRRDTRITGIDKYNQHLGVSNLEIAGAPIDGRSGGGLFDDSGRLIGVCNAADYKDDVGIYAGPGNIHWQLDRVGLTELYQDSAPRYQDSVPRERIASLPDTPATPAVANQETTIQPAALTAPLQAQPSPNRVHSQGTQEVIVIVRDRGNPRATSQVMTLNQPSADLMQLIRQQAQ